MPKYHVILNKGAGTAGQEQQKLIRQAFVDSGESFKIHLSTGDPAISAREAAQDTQCEVLVGAGGDGTIGAVAGVVLEKGRVLGVIPAGTLNHFARDLGIPTDLTQAVAAIVNGKAHKIDYVTAGDRLCLNNLSLGIYAKLVRKREQTESQLGKWPAAALSALSLLRRPLHRSKLTLRYGGRSHRLISPFIFIGNNDYHTSEGGFGGRTSLTGGRLTLFAYTDASWVKLALELAKVFAGHSPSYSMRTASPTEVVIEALTKTLEVAIDGEVLRLPAPLKVALHPAGLSIKF